MVIMTLNCGSSSVKYQVYDWDEHEALASGIVERVTQAGSVIKHKARGKDEHEQEHPCPDHRVAIELIIATILDPTHGAIADISEVKAVGHRVVHGGEKFAKSVLVTDEVLAAFREIQDLAPLHNPANIMGIEAAQSVLPEVPHCAIMDTAWHQTMPKKAFLYALPYDWYRKYGVRRYGFHGTSFLYTAKRAAVLLGKDPFQINLIIAHIGNGASINAVRNGVSVDTSMGLTPLEGLIMGTRSGDIDPAIPFYMVNTAGMKADDVERALNKSSGVFGITEKYVDRRDIELAAEAGDEQAALAIEMEAYRIRKYIGAYAAALGRVDAVVFTAGVGERGPLIREKATEGLEFMGIKLDRARNAASRTKNAETIISTNDSPTRILVIPTDEELVMTEDTFAIMQGTYDAHTNFTYSFQTEDYQNKERNGCIDRDIEKVEGLGEIVLSADRGVRIDDPECE
ncbi:MAG: acetate kinase [Spirochaetaceae bacterium]|nr:MAG: acetate kinase [Spirochaetaceae bacterium]